LAPESYGDVMIRIATVAYSCSFAQAALSIVLVEAALKCRYLKARHDDKRVCRYRPAHTAEWAAMADYHLRALRLAYVIANSSASALAGGLQKQMANVATMLGQAAQFHRAFAELCETAERLLIDASL
jgi:hypothetical protein